MAVLYQIANWSSLYENSRSRQCQTIRWVPIPNKHDSDGYAQIVDHPNGAAHYGCWCVLVQVASKCQPRGRLMLRNTNTPHDGESLSRVTRLPAAIFEEAIPRFIDVGWLLTEVVADTEDTSQGVGRVSGACQAGVGRVSGARTRREGKGREEKKKTPLNPPRGKSGFDPLKIELPTVLDTVEFRAAWAEWAQHRKEIRHKLTPTSSVRSLNALERLGVDRAIASITHTVEKGWRGIVEAPEPPAAEQKPRYVN